MENGSKRLDAFLCDKSIAQLVKAGHVRASRPDASIQIEPASIDIEACGRHALVPVSFPPGRDESIAETIEALRATHVPGSTRIQPGSNYVTITRLAMDLDLPPDVKAVFSPKSSIGRLDVQVRVLADRSGRYDDTPFGYKGALYAEIVSESFPVSINATEDGIGAPITQVRFVRSGMAAGEPTSDTLVGTEGLTLDMSSARIGWIADPADPTLGIDVGHSVNLPIEDYWRPLKRSAQGVVLRKGPFHIAASHETISVAADRCAILRQVDMTLGNLASHYAGFADPMFGLKQKSRMVFEIRNHGHPMLVRPGQTVAILETHRLDAPCAVGYGARRDSYQGQTLRLSRCFRQD